MIASVRFAGDLHPLLIIGFALLAAIAVAKLYLRETQSIAAPYSYLLPGLRASAVALAILILAGPVWHRRQTIGTLGRVVFAIDQSRSMALTDSIAGGSSPSRSDRASQLLTGTDVAAGWLGRLEKSHIVDVVAFSIGDLTNVWTSRDAGQPPLTFGLVADGPSTDLAAPMQIAADSSDQTNQTAVVLLSDGRDNAGASPIDAAARLKALGVKVNTIGIGSTDEPDDIGISRVIHPTTVAADVPLAGTLLIRQSGFDGQPVVVRIEHLGEAVWRQTVSLDSPEVSVPFQLDIESMVRKIQASVPRGVQRSIAVLDLHATVEAIEGDSRTENNSRSFRVAASTHEHRLLILDGSSRWEMRYLRNLFARNPEWSVDTLLYGPGTDLPIIDRGPKAGQFPNTAEAFARYDAIILGEIPADQWTDRDAELLRDFVSRGGGLIVIDGRYGRVKDLAEQSLADLIPVNYLDNPAKAVRSIRPSRIGSGHPALNLWPGEADQMSFWENLPAPPSVPDVQSQAGAEVLADALTFDGLSVPWLVTRMFGAGRVVYVSTDQTWRWRYKVADRFHWRFWNQLIATTIQPPYSVGDSYVALGSDRIEYQSGESATIRARLRNPDGEPIGDSTVEALLVKQDQIVARIPLAADDPARGTYRGRTGPLALGDYSLRIRASGIDPNVLRATTPIWVETRDTGELDRVSLDSPLLQQIAANGGGVYFHESEADRMIDQLEPLSTGRIVESDILIWQSFYWFVIVIAMLTAEWWIRKRLGLM